MPDVNVNISIESIAKIIKKMNKKDLEKLSLLLTDESKKILKRKKEIEDKKVKTLSREEVFDV
ncbi:MAG: hypothetical protein GY754_10840 [bacterium]|nr:hypothetical protein [bacterium]